LTINSFLFISFITFLQSITFPTLSKTYFLGRSVVGVDGVGVGWEGSRITRLVVWVVLGKYLHKFSFEVFHMHKFNFEVFHMHKFNFEVFHMHKLDPINENHLISTCVACMYVCIYVCMYVGMYNYKNKCHVYLQISVQYKNVMYII